MKRIVIGVFISLTMLSSYAQVKVQPMLPASSTIQNNNALESFGYKISWYMIEEAELNRKHLTIFALASRLNLQQPQSLSWNQGIDWQYKNYTNKPSCFITPALHGWVYIKCSVQDELNLLEGIVDNYYAFTSYRIVDAVAWKIVKNGKLERYFTYADGQVYHNEDKQTLAEKQLGFVDLSGLDNDSALDKIYQDVEENETNTHYSSINDEENPAKLYERLTGQNPINFEDFSLDDVKGNGIIGFLPNK